MVKMPIKLVCNKKSNFEFGYSALEIWRIVNGNGADADIVRMRRVHIVELRFD